MTNLSEKKWTKVDATSAEVLQKLHTILNPMRFISGHEDWKSEGFPENREYFFDSTWLLSLFEEIPSLTPNELLLLQPQRELVDSQVEPYTKDVLIQLVHAILSSESSEI